MKEIVILLFLLLKCNFLFSQEEGNWVKFEDEKTFLIGYKDLKGAIKIKPRFTFITNAEIFENIIPVFEEMNLKNDGNSELNQYYLLKNGKHVGLDSLYVYDTTLDCESENKIRFRDSKTDKVGFFDSNGKVLIPAVYDEAKPFYNGFSVVIKKGKRICWNGSGVFSKENPCDGWSWQGNYAIINEKNEVLVENIPYEKLNAIDWFSVKKNSKETDENYIEFKSNDGDVYAFLNYEKEFKNWFYNQFLKDISAISVVDFLSDEIHYDVNEIQENESKIRLKDSFWKEEKKENFLKNHIEYFLKTISLFSNNEIHITEGTSPALFRYENSQEYFSNCGEYQNIKFPYFRVYLLDKNQKVLKILGFIKTEKRFRLLEIY